MQQQKGKHDILTVEESAFSDADEEEEEEDRGHH